MKIEEILDFYPIEVLEQLASNKVMDISHIRLPKGVLIEELSGIINKACYVERIISFRNPPNFQILDTLLNFPEYKAPVKGFKDKIIEYTQNLIEKAKQLELIKTSKNNELYLKMLKTAWESDLKIDASETHLLNALRDELNISFKEHTILIHHEDLIKFWYDDNYYERERNFLISSGIIFPLEEYYIIPDSVGRFIRQSWGMDLNNDQYKRMLSFFSNNDLTEILLINDLPISGTTIQKIQRILENYIPPRKTLSVVNVESLRNAARRSGSIISGIKEEVVENLIDYFDDDSDLDFIEHKTKRAEEIVPENKILLKEKFIKLFNLLSNEQLYNIACYLKKIKKSGNKESKINNLWDSPYCEQTLLNQLTNSELHLILEKNKFKISGPKNEKINRLIKVADDINKNNDFINNSENITYNLINESTKDQILSTQNKNVEVFNNSNILNEQEYNFLDKNEIVVLSWIKDLKSVNEYELERLISRYDLPWYFPRTQMEELKTKLEINEKDELLIRHVGDYCLYEFKFPMT